MLPSTRSNNTNNPGPRFHSGFSLGLHFLILGVAAPWGILDVLAGDALDEQNVRILGGVDMGHHVIDASRPIDLLLSPGSELERLGDEGRQAECCSPSATSDPKHWSGALRFC